MQKIQSIIRIMRMPNLLIVILTMFILRYGLIRPFLFSGETGMMSGWLDFSLLVLSTVLITVAGYIINDRFDVGIDAINKPGKNKIGVDLSERSAIIMYRILNAIALIIAVYLAFRLQSLTLGLLFPFIIYLVWLYSSRYKKTLIWGNLIVAFLSAMVIFMVWYFEFLHLRLRPDVFATVLPDMKNINLFFIFYALFAFLNSLFREIIKDIEDRKGDAAYECKTLALVYGEIKARYMAAGIIILTILLICFFQGILVNRGWTAVLWYFIIVVQLPMAYLAVKLLITRKEPDYHFLSSLSKLVMVAGILSIQLIYSSL